MNIIRYPKEMARLLNPKYTAPRPLAGIRDVFCACFSIFAIFLFSPEGWQADMHTWMPGTDAER
jgi:hypothetical protein